MPFWIAFLWWLGSQIALALLAKPRIEDARPSGLDDFQIPTATEGRVVPLIVGKVKMAGPNVIWYGDLEARAIREKIGGFFGIGGKNITKGYEYRIGVQMAISRGPIDGIDRIWMGDRVISSGESAADRVILDPDFFGGADSGGGIDFTLGIELGTRTQVVHPYIATVQTPTPAYKSTAFAILFDGSLGGGLIGQTAQLRNIAFEPFFYPNALGVTGGKERIGNDANPICFLFEILSANDDWGLEIPGTDILITGTSAEGALRALAEDVADEGLGFSMIIDRAMEANELIGEIERHVDGAFRLDLSDGKFKIILARPPVGPITVLDESNIVEFKEYTRANWADTKNELRVGFADRAKDYGSSFALDHDLANREIVGGLRNIQTLNFPGIKTAALANIIAARELIGFSIPLAKIKLIVDRSLYTVQRGDPVDVTWPDYGIVTLPMRIIKVKYDNDQTGQIVLDAVEDVFRLQTTGFVDPPATGWIPTNTTAVAALDERLWQLPLGLSESGARRVATLATRNGGLHLSYEIHADLTGGTDFVLTNTTDSWTPTAQLAGVMTNSVATIPVVVIDGGIDFNATDLDEWSRPGFDVTDPENLILIDDELMFFKTATDNLDGTFDLNNVHRAQLETAPVSHADNARVWFPVHGAGLIIPEELDPAPVTIKAKLLTRTANSFLAIGSAAQLTITTEDREGYGYNYGNNYGGP